jgi:hypothetical protein
MTQNPLSKYFRQPILYVKLPSEGKWYPNDEVDIPVTGEVPIYAMTAKDEITMKTPDALLNGASTVNLIESCCPAIKNAWHMPVVDLDILLMSIRIASYGKEMEFTSVCTHCGSKHEKAIDLTVMMDRIKLANWTTPEVINGLTIKLKPQNYEEFNKNNLMNFEQQRIMQLVSDETLDENVKLVKFNEMFNKLVDLGLNQIAKSIESITLEDGNVVINSLFIAEFLSNCDRSVWDRLKQRMEQISKDNELSVKLVCESPECAKEYDTPFVFEQARFFV